MPKIEGRTDDKSKTSLETGAVFNINNRDKDKTLLFIIPYFRFADLTDKRRTPIATGITETKPDFEKRNIIIGLKVGIPISLPKRTE